MRTLLIYPQFPQGFWSFEKSLALQDKKALFPPLGLITVAAILPQDWEFKLVDCAVRTVTEAEWEWAELVILSGMIVQQDDLLAQIREAKRRGKTVAVGGPYVTSTPEPAKAAGADYLILNEGEITLPMFVEALDRGETSGTFSTSEKPDVTQTPIPRYDLLDLDAYSGLSVQFSRGCPFQCEFCDIIVLYGRKPRTKSPAQFLQELECLYHLGWRGTIMLVDDNFIGNKRNVKILLDELKTWQIQHDYPFSFTTEASIDLAKDPGLMDLMVECNFWSVFIGIETPDEDSLKVTQKFQNLRDPLLESIDTILRSGLQIQAGLIVGFDGEKTGAGDRIVEFVQQASIPTAMFGLLQALPNTALWHRLEKEGRLLPIQVFGNMSALMNFVPTRPVEEIAKEYVEGVWKLYEPDRYLDRVFNLVIKLNEAKTKHKHCGSVPLLIMLKTISQLLWKYGVTLKTRSKFWFHVWSLLRQYPDWVVPYIMSCTNLEHFLEYRETVRDRIGQQLIAYQNSLQDTPELVQIAS